MCFPNTKFFRFVRQEFVSVMNRNHLEAALQPRYAGLGALTRWVLGDSRRPCALGFRQRS